MNTAWRFIPLLEASGKRQMAIDQWLFQQHQQGYQPPILRFYTWSPVAISLGYHQRYYPSAWHQLTWQDQPLDLVRRPTGGRAVLHQGDLTYMMVTSDLCGNLSQVYQMLCQFLRLGWQSLGIELNYGQAGRGYIHSSNCFGTATNADLVDQYGNKFIGSAQFKQGNTILQQGSMLINPDRNLFQRVFGEFPPHKVTFIDSISHDKIIQALTQAACQCFEMELITEPLCEEEGKMIQESEKTLLHPTEKNCRENNQS